MILEMLAADVRLLLGEGRLLPGCLAEACTSVDVDGEEPPSY